MSRSYSGNTVVWVEVDGYEAGVYIEYQVDIDTNYGADADGNRGEYRESCEITSSYIQEPRSLPLTEKQFTQMVLDAEKKFLRERGYHGT